MSDRPNVTVYTDYKSPYAFLAKDLAYDLEREADVRLLWRPYILISQASWAPRRWTRRALC